MHACCLGVCRLHGLESDLRCARLACVCGYCNNNSVRLLALQYAQVPARGQMSVTSLLTSHGPIRVLALLPLYHGDPPVAWRLVNSH